MKFYLTKEEAKRLFKRYVHHDVFNNPIRKRLYAWVLKHSYPVESKL